MTTQTQEPGTTRRLKAAIIALGLDGPLRPFRIIQGEECVLVGGSDETRAALLETMLRLESELERSGRRLGELEPSELHDLAFRIDSPELAQIADRLEEGLRRRGCTFGEVSAAELTEIAATI